MTVARNRTTRLLGIVVLLGAAISLLLFLDRFRIGSYSLVWLSVRNFGHVPLFGFLAVILLWILRLSFGRRPGASLQYSMAWIGVAGIGALSEYLQITTQRDADIIDWLLDMAGAAAFLALYFTIEPQLSDRGRRLKDRYKAVIRIAAFIILVCAAIPVLTSAAAHVYRRAMFPRIQTFDSYLERKYLEASNVEVKIVRPPDAWTGHTSRVAEATFLTSRYPTMYFSGPFPDWAGYHTLRMDIFSPLEVPVILNISIKDCRVAQYNDRYNGALQIKPGYNELKIPLAEIEHAPAERTLDLSSVVVILVFMVEPEQPTVLYFDDLILE